MVLVLIFGAKRLPEVGRSLGAGLREFSHGLKLANEPLELAKEPVELAKGSQKRDAG